MKLLIEYLIQGVLIGTTYGLVALPISVVYATTHSVDAAVGAHAVVAAVVAWHVGGVLGMVVGLGAAALSASAVALIFVALRRRGASDPISIVLATFGAAFALESIVLWRHGRDPVIDQPTWQFWDMGGIRLNPQSVLNLAIGVAVMLVLVLVLQRSGVGRALRASADNPIGAGLAGLAVERLQFLAILMGGVLAGVAGLLLLRTTGMTYSSGMHLTLTAIGAAVIFGFKGPLHGFAGGVLLGVVEALVGGYSSGGLAQAIPFLFILVVLGTNRGVVSAARP